MVEKKIKWTKPMTDIEEAQSGNVRHAFLITGNKCALRRTSNEIFYVRKILVIF